MEMIGQCDKYLTIYKTILWIIVCIFSSALPRAALAYVSLTHVVLTNPLFVVTEYFVSEPALIGNQKIQINLLVRKKNWSRLNKSCLRLSNCYAQRQNVINFASLTGHFYKNGHTNILTSRSPLLLLDVFPSSL